MINKYNPLSPTFQPMLKYLIITILLGLQYSAISQDFSAFIGEADKFYEEGQYEASQKAYAQAFEIKEGSASNYYNAACSAALAGNIEPALSFLQKSVDKGWTNIRHAKKDSDLNNLHETKEWTSILGVMQAKVDSIEQFYNKPLRDELQAIYDYDQAVRFSYIDATKEFGYEHPTVDSLMKEMIIADSVNLAKIERILDEHGWVSRDTVGRANSAIFLVVQHSPLEVQQKYLPMAKEAMKKGDLRPSQMALLVDRVALREGRKQTYGSQISRDPETNESYVMPLENPETVDKRRAEVGLPPLSEYVARWSIKWDVEEYKKNLPKYEAIQKERMEKRKKKS